MTVLPDLTTGLMGLGLAALLGYILGSIPFGLVIARVMNLGDLRSIGSGNIGATNVLRTGSKLGAFLTLILDSGKAGIAVLIARALAAEDAAQIAGLCALIGHCFPIWLRFEGGKGVATFFGLLFALAWPVGLAAGATWLTVAFVTRYSSMSALMAAALAPLWMALLNTPHMIALAAALAVLIFARHHANIARLLNGTEGKIGKSG